MNFFEQQHRARRRTWLLVLYFVVAVALIIAAINLAVYFVVVQASTPAPPLEAWLQEPYWIWIALATLMVIVIGTLKTVLRLRGGGRAVAEMVGARRVQRDTDDLDERRLINVVEEISIASGTPAPTIYVLDEEPAINAFVAGLRPTEAVLVVTRGTLENLTRDELQGVIGHEYSHVLNGDMRINIRLMGVLAGLLLIGQLGRILLRTAGRGSSRKGGGQAALLGLALFIIGYIGIFFGALIKAAISRQREFLADASSVQFTRNPDGIAGALWKIQQHATGSLLNNDHSDDLSHFCFGESVSAAFTSLMSTHPPLHARINAIDPGFMARAGSVTAARPAVAAGPPPAGAAGFAGGGAALTGAAVAASVGQVSAANLDTAERIHAALAPELLETLHRSGGARETVYALLLAAMAGDEREAGRAVIARHEGREVADAALALVARVKAAGAGRRLVLLNLAVPALKLLEWESRARLLAAADDLIRSDGRYTVFEFALMTVLREHISEDADRDPHTEYFKFDRVLGDIRLLLSVLARTGAAGEAEAASAYRHVIRQFDRQAPDLAPPADCTLPGLTAALENLNRLSPMLKQSVIRACADCVIHDGKVRPGEAELLQAIALALDCPLPPLEE